MKRYLYFLFLVSLGLVFGLGSNPVLAAEESSGSVEAGDLVKCPDFPSVYLLAEDGERHVFPNENVFFSWYEDFDEVIEISCDDLAEISVGDLVSYQAGTSLVTTPSTNDVYVVLPDGELELIEDEQQAEDLYGENWSELVDDISETFFVHYDVVGVLEDGEIPEGMIFVDDDGNMYRSDESGTLLEIDDIISEDTQLFLEDFAEDLEDISDRYLENYSADLEQQLMAFNQEVLDEFFSVMQSYFLPYSSFQSSEDGQSDDFSSIQPIMILDNGESSSDDEDDDGIKDFWGDHQMDFEDSDEGSDFWDDFFQEWDELDELDDLDDLDELDELDDLDDLDELDELDDLDELDELDDLDELDELDELDVEPAEEDIE